jgi:DNA repair protein RecO (recombination protein O)
VNISYSQKETRDLVNLNSCDLLQSQFNLATDFDASLALDFIAEVSEHLLPEHEPNEHYFRLMATVLNFAHSGTPGCMWSAITYFSLWATRLSGFLPELANQRLSLTSRDLAAHMLRTHIAEMPERIWNKDTALDLRRFLIHLMEDHVERRFHTPALLESL